jgi:hypothetical protein
VTLLCKYVGILLRIINTFDDAHIDNVWILMSNLKFPGADIIAK